MGFPSILPVIVILAVALTGAAIIIAIRSKRGEPVEDRHELDLDIGYGAICPNCRSHATSEREGSFEKRRCETCGQKFDLHG